MEKLIELWQTIKSGLEYKLLEFGDHSISIYNLVFFLSIILFFRILLKWIEGFVKRRVSDKKWVSEGKQLAIIQIAKYLIYVIGFVLSLEAIGLDTTTFLISSSALFVGLGFGLQEAFRDFISGLIILFEGDVIIGDIIEMDNGTVGVVKRINLRTSKVRTRDGIVMIVPNSQLVNDRVINWSNSNKLTRFNVEVGVAYGSDTELVQKILLEAATQHSGVSTRIKPFVRFSSFGESSLDFQLYFWTEEVWQIEDIKSQLRLLIDKDFRTSKVTIPFPQRDFHFKSSNISFKD